MVVFLGMGVILVVLGGVGLIRPEAWDSYQMFWFERWFTRDQAHTVTRFTSGFVVLFGLLCLALALGFGIATR